MCIRDRLLAIVLFFFLPTWLFNVCEQYLFGEGIEGWRSIVEGAMRIGIFVAYIAVVAHMPEIKRVFQYHGAEHKTIFCYENEEELTVENVRRHGRFHCLLYTSSQPHRGHRRLHRRNKSYPPYWLDY